MSFIVKVDSEFYDKSDSKLIQAQAIAKMLMTDGFNQEQSEGHYNSHETIRDAIWCIQELIGESIDLTSKGIDTAKEKVYD